MQWHFTPYVVPLLGSALIATALALYAWRRRGLPGAEAFAATALLVSIWSLTDVVETFTPDLAEKIFLSDFQYICFAGIPVCWLIMSLQCCGRERWLTLQRGAWLFAVPAITIALVWTNNFHHLMHIDARLDTASPVTVLVRTFGPFYWVHTAYSYAALLASIVMLFITLVQAPPAYRGRTAVLLAGMMIPTLWNVPYVLGFGPLQPIDMTPLFLGLGGFVVAWGLFRFRIFGIVPVAYGQVVAGMDDGVIVLDLSYRVVDLNPAAQAIIGHTARQVVDAPVQQIFGATPEVNLLCESVPPAKAEMPLLVSGRSCWYEISVSPLKDYGDRSIGRVVVFHDITERRLMEEALRDSESKYRELADSLPQPVFEVGRDLRLTFANQSAFTSFGYTKEDFEAGVNVAQTIVPGDWSRALENIKKVMRGEPATGQEYEALRKDGTTFPIAVYSNRIVKNGHVAGLRGVIIDITERKRTETELIYASCHDPLTGLYNRGHFEDVLRRLEGGSSYPVTIVSTDLDELKLLNDNLGHRAGDDLLKVYASLLRSAFRKSDVIARVGGDEFAIILPQTNRDEAEDIYRRLQNQIEFHNRCRPGLPLSISLGAETSYGPELPMEEAFRASDLKMYEDKSRKPDRQQSPANIR